MATAVDRMQPPPAQPPVAQMSEEQLAQNIRDKHGMMLRQFKSSVLTAIEVGELLHEAKKRVQGVFEAWIKDHCQFSYRTARRYMNMAKNKEKLLAQLNAPAAPAVLGDLSASRLLTDQSGGSNNNTSTPPSVVASEKYDRAEERLIETLKKLPVAQVDDAMEKTIKELRSTARTMKAGATNKAA